VGRLTPLHSRRAAERYYLGDTMPNHFPTPNSKTEPESIVPIDTPRLSLTTGCYLYQPSATRSLDPLVTSLRDRSSRGSLRRKRGPPWAPSLEDLDRDEAASSFPALAAWSGQLRI
jgi:hypothetical protein